MKSLFLSHSHSDHEVAAALKQLIENCFAGHIDVKASSAAPSEGGLAAGSDWLDWITSKSRRVSLLSSCSLQTQSTSHG